MTSKAVFVACGRVWLLDDRGGVLMRENVKFGILASLEFSRHKSLQKYIEFI